MTTRTRSSRRATTRSTRARAATRRSTRGARPATRTTCAARCCASSPRPAAATRSRPGTCSRRARRKTRPEIYLMGLRNPFRIAVNRTNDDLYVADYSPDAGAADPNRGPAGTGKWFVARGPGNYGWPFCATDELPYNDYDFATKTSGPKFNCAAPVNDSPNNTGLRDLPPVRHPDVWYSYSASAGFPELGTGGVGPMARPGVQLQAELHVADQVAAVLRQRAAVLRVDAGLHQGDAARRCGQPSEDQPGPAVVHVRQPDGHRVRRGRRAVHARVRHRLLRHAAGGPARPRRLRAREPDADRQGGGRPGGQSDRSARGPRSRARARAIPTATVSPTSGTSTPTGRSTRPSRTRRTRSTRPASTTRR